MVDLARDFSAAQDPVGGKRKHAIGKAKPAPATGRGRIAPPFGRISLVEFACQQAIDIRRQSGDERVIVSVHEEDIVAFLDRRRIEHRLPGHGDAGQQDRKQPRLVASRHLAGERDHRRGDEHAIAEQVVERQSDDGHKQRQQGQSARQAEPPRV